MQTCTGGGGALMGSMAFTGTCTTTVGRTPAELVIENTLATSDAAKMIIDFLATDMAFSLKWRLDRTGASVHEEPGEGLETGLKRF
jgi:hypothetical protein